LVLWINQLKKVVFNGANYTIIKYADGKAMSAYHTATLQSSYLVNWPPTIHAIARSHGAFDLTIVPN